MAFPIHRIPLIPHTKDFRYGTIGPANLPWVMRHHILTGAMGSTYINLTTGMFLVAFGNAIGVSIMQWGVLGAISCFAITAQLATAYGAERIGYRRAIWFAAELANRLLRAAAIVTAYWLMDRGFSAWAPSALVGLMCLASIPGAGAGPPWYSWLADIIPERIHGAFMGRRDAWIACATIALVVPASIAVDMAPQGAKVDVLSLVFGLGMAVGVIDLSLHRRIPEPQALRDNERSFLQSALAPLRNPAYKRWLAFTIFWNFALFLGGSLATIFFVEDLHIREHVLGGSLVLIAVPLLSIMITGKTVGRYVDRLGVKWVLIGSHFLWAVLPVFWILATPATALFWLTISSIFGGAGASAAINASYKIMTRVPPRRQRAMYIAVAACLGNLAGGLATLLAGYFLEGLKGHQWMVAGMTLVPFHVIFLASTVLRLAAWAILFGMKTPSFDSRKTPLPA